MACERGTSATICSANLPSWFGSIVDKSLFISLVECANEMGLFRRAYIKYKPLGLDGYLDGTSRKFHLTPTQILAHFSPKLVFKC